jgi:hypothetical protein
MIARQTAIPIAMERARQRFEQWRRTRTPRRSPIPDALWAAAVAVGRRHGLYATSRALRLDYTALKKRMPAARDRAAAPASPTFVELTPASLGTCVIEREGPGGTLRLRLPALAPPDLVALSRALFGGDA